MWARPRGDNPRKPSRLGPRRSERKSDPHHHRLGFEQGGDCSRHPDGDKILFGEATDSEDEASHSRGRRGAAQDAMWVYHAVYELFPNSPLAGEALYRAADIRWQLDKVDVMTKPSAREQDAYLRGEIDDSWMKETIKKFPGTKWADLAAYRIAR